MSDSSKNQSQSQSQTSGGGASIAEPGQPDATSPYRGPDDAPHDEKRPETVADGKGPESMEQPYFSEAQSTLGANAPAGRTGDPFTQPEDAIGTVPPPSRAEQQPQRSGTQEPASFATPEGTVREGMAVVDNYGHTLGYVAGVDGERLRLTSTDPHDDGVAFLPVSLIDGIDGERVLLAGRGDASFGQAAD